jgi:hypothetical protein
MKRYVDLRQSFVKTLLPCDSIAAASLTLFALSGVAEKECLTPSLTFPGQIIPPVISLGEPPPTPAA